MMMISLIYSAFILMNVLMNILPATSRDNLSLSEHQVDRLCNKINKMKLMPQSDDKIEKYLKKELDHLVIGYMRATNRKLNDQAKGYDYTHHEHDQEDGQRVDIQSDNVIGEKAMLNEIKIIGTDASRGGHSFLLNLQETNNDIKSSEINYFSTSLYTNAELSPMRGNTSTDTSRGERNPLHSRLNDNIGNAHLSRGDCEAMIQSVYNQKIQSSNLVEKLTNVPIESAGKMAKSPLHRSRTSDGSNSTFISTQYSAGPDSFVTYILHESRGDAVISDTASDTENQVHQNFEDSKVTAVNIVVPIVNPP
ncbi:uncharacterized protein LOC141849257 [Brevipalpus obovatus]|uniref:uncharacterized protein LOC141849257 n=1 Tax=Brevipalpus obovatus TaxID=246614 RepID=UPI003D9ECE4D